MRQILSGIGASVGKVQGKIKVINGLNDYDKVKEGDVLVTKMTDPTMTIIMGKAGAIITDTGGIACHAAIVSRELGIPCIVAAKDATKTLKEGDLVHVCGTSGNIYLVRG